jgi:putative DNA primase/helicase
LWVAANHDIPISGTDEGIWSRIRKIPFTVTIPEAERDTHLPEKLRVELPGILNWALEGCLAWRCEGLGLPQEVKQATEDYRREMDVLGQFLAECCVVHPTQPSIRTQSSVLHDAYRWWSGVEITQTAFSLHLKQRGFTRQSLDGRQYWSGIELLTLTNTSEDG